MNNPAEQYSHSFTYGDYLAWPDDERWELIDGMAYAMTAPSRLHQELVFELGAQIRNYLQGKDCKGYVAPFDVRLPQADEADEQVDTLVQPDILVVCDRSKLDDKGCRGAPDWIIEVLSPSTARRDMDSKRKLYEKHGVREYWLVNPSERWLMIYRLDAKACYEHPVMFDLVDSTVVGIFEDLAIEWGFVEGL